MIGQLEGKGDLVEIAVLHDLKKFEFVFFKPELPYSKICSFQVVRKHLNRGMFAHRDFNIKSDEFFAALFYS